MRLARFLLWALVAALVCAAATGKKASKKKHSHGKADKTVTNKVARRPPPGPELRWTGSLQQARCQSQAVSTQVYFDIELDGSQAGDHPTELLSSLNAASPRASITLGFWVVQGVLSLACTAR